MVLAFSSFMISEHHNEFWCNIVVRQLPSIATLLSCSGNLVVSVLHFGCLVVTCSHKLVMPRNSCGDARVLKREVWRLGSSSIQFYFEWRLFGEMWAQTYLEYGMFGFTVWWQGCGMLLYMVCRTLGVGWLGLLFVLCCASNCPFFLKKHPFGTISIYAYTYMPICAHSVVC
jgi:hypothetical protein